MVEIGIIVAIFQWHLKQTGKFIIIFVRLMLGNVGVDGFTEPQWESDIRYEFDLKVVLKGLGCK